MTIYIPEWGAASGPEIQLRRLFNELGDDAVVRTPLARRDGEPDYVIECPGQGWLALAVRHERHEAIDGAQLFDSPARQAFLRYLEGLAGIDPKVPVLIVMWACSTREAAALAADAPGTVQIWSREQLQDGGGGALRRIVQPVAGGESLLRRRYFPESEITAVSVGRRQFQRNNGATLTGIFLDQEQEWASKLDLSIAPAHEELTRDVSVRLLNGVAGSGKTLIALQRGILLANAHPQQRVLMLILNTPVVADLAERVHRAGRLLPANLEMLTFASWAIRQWRQVFGRHPSLPQGPGDVLALVGELRPALPLERLTDQQLVQELDYLNDALIDSEAEYVAADRAGRGFALREVERRQVWALYLEVTERLAARGMRLWSAVARELCHLPDQSRLQRYHHILVDEAQFLGPSALQVVKHALQPGASLFLCADPRQGFMRSRLSWKSIGLDVSGRTRKLRRSYRTTSSVLRAATCLLARAVDDDPEDYLTPDYGGMEVGVAPILVEAGSPQDAVDRVANEIRALAASPRFPLSTVLVLYGERAPKAMLHQRLCQAVGHERVWWLNRKQNRKLPPGGYGGEHLRLASLETATGLEGTFVFLVGVDHLLHPGPGDGANDRQAESNARKLYMAMTRSCYRLTVVSSQTYDPARFDGIFEKRP